MIYDLKRAVEEAFAAGGYPTPVVYGPERMARPTAGSVVVIERDRSAGDTFAGPRGQRRNVRRQATRFVGVQVRIWARSALDGAGVHDHEAEADALIDAVYCAARAWSHRTTGLAEFPISEARFLAAADLADLETWPGVVYVMRWRVPRGVYTRDYSGAGLPEVSAVLDRGSVEVRRNADDPPEIVELP